MARAKRWEHTRDHAAARLPNFEYAEALYQIAIVLGSVAIVAASPWLLGVSGVLAAFGLALTINGYLLLVPLPHGDAAHAAPEAAGYRRQTGGGIERSRVGGRAKGAAGYVATCASHAALRRKRLTPCASGVRSISPWPTR